MNHIDAACDLTFELKLGGEEARVVAQEIAVDAQGEIAWALDEDNGVERAVTALANSTDTHQLALTP